MNDDTLRYPIGKFVPEESYTSEGIKTNIDSIEMLPAKVQELVKAFSPEQWDIPYRENGWTGRQVIHHMADSHMNSYIRFKWTLTEPTPVIKAYDEKAWAETPETNLAPDISLSLLKALHIKWVALMRLVTKDDLKKSFIHPDTKKHNSIERLIALYAWHGEHHLGHLRIIASKHSLQR
jgi:hypothetical protein